MLTFDAFERYLRVKFSWYDASNKWRHAASLHWLRTSACEKHAYVRVLKFLRALLKIRVEHLLCLFFYKPSMRMHLSIIVFFWSVYFPQEVWASSLVQMITKFAFYNFWIYHRLKIGFYDALNKWRHSACLYWFRTSACDRHAYVSALQGLRELPKIRMEHLLC